MYIYRTGRDDITDCDDCPSGYYCADRGATQPSGQCRAGHICFGNALIADPVYNDDPAGIYLGNFIIGVIFIMFV